MQKSELNTSINLVEKYVQKFNKCVVCLNCLHWSGQI